MAALVIGLGNPGGEYASSRHNLGWRCLDEIERRGRFSRPRREGSARVAEGAVEGYDMVLARPTTFMNLSGRAGAHLTAKFGVSPEDVVVVHDDLDLTAGRVQVKRGGGAGGQKGVLSLIGAWRTKDFLRVRIGIGRPPDGQDPTDYVLETPRPDERAALDEAVLRAADAVVSIVRVGADQTMMMMNRR